MQTKFIKLEQLSKVNYFKAGLNSSHFKMLIVSQILPLFFVV